jgi:hypothetical protein
MNISPPPIDLNDKNILHCREYLDYEKIDKSPRRKEDIVKTLKRGCLVLDRLGVRYSVGRGSALGLNRTNEFLPTDIDIDIDVFGDEQVYQIIKQFPFDELFVTSSNGHYHQFAFLDRDTDVIFDIYFYQRQGNYWLNRNYFGYHWLPVAQYINLKSLSYEGFNLPCPDLDWYCSFWYGEDWRTPKRYNGVWSDYYQKDCKGFIYWGEKDIVNERLF